MRTHEASRQRPGPNPGDFDDRRRARPLEIVDISAGLQLGGDPRGGQAAGEFEIEDLSITRLALLGMHNFTVQWIQPRGAMSAAEISRHYCRTVMTGIARSVDWTALDNEVRAASKLLRADSDWTLSQQIHSTHSK